MFGGVEEVISNEKLENVDMGTYDKHYEKGGEYELETYGFGLYLGDVNHLKGNGSKYKAIGDFDPTKMDRSVRIDSENYFRSNKLLLSKYKCPGLKDLFSKPEVLKFIDSYYVKDENNLKESSGEQAFIKVYKAIRDAKLDDYFRIYTTICHIHMRHPNFFLNFIKNMFYRVKNWVINSGNKKVLPTKGFNPGKPGPNEFKFEENDFCSDLLELEDIFDGKKNPKVNPFSHEGKVGKKEKKRKLSILKLVRRLNLICLPLRTVNSKSWMMPSKWSGATSCQSWPKEIK